MSVLLVVPLLNRGKFITGVAGGALGFQSKLASTAWRQVGFHSGDIGRQLVLESYSEEERVYYIAPNPRAISTPPANPISINGSYIPYGDYKTPFNFSDNLLSLSQVQVNENNIKQSVFNNALAVDLELYLPNPPSNNPYIEDVILWDESRIEIETNQNDGLFHQSSSSVIVYNNGGEIKIKTNCLTYLKAIYNYTREDWTIEKTFGTREEVAITF